jgi:type I restriction enzyme S subunit
LGNPLGLCCEVPTKYDYGVIVADLIRVRPDERKVFKKYLIHAINSPVIQSQFQEITKGTTRPRVNLTIVRSITFLLPPLNEQRRIVAKIEALFSELDDGVASLKTAAAQLKTYRQALLKHAFEGKLTAEWRAENQDKLETAETLLQRIKAERQARYEAETAEWEANGKNGRKPQPPKELPPLTERETAELPELPDGWAWVRVGALSDLISGNAFKKDEYSDEGIRLFQIANVTFGTISWEKIAFLPEDYWGKYPDLQLFAGDLVMALNRPLLGDELKIGILNSMDVPAILYQRVGKFIPYFSEFNRLLFWYLRSPKFINTLKQDLRGVNIPFINQSRLMEYPIPLCNFEELDQIFEQLEREFSIIDQLEQTISNALQQAEALRQSILKKAFAGQLVPQDPNDEPAAALLARIRAGKHR